MSVAVLPPGQTIAAAPPPPPVMLTTATTVLLTPPPRLIYVDDKPCTYVQKSALVIPGDMPDQVRVVATTTIVTGSYADRRV